MGRRRRERSMEGGRKERRRRMKVKDGKVGR